MGPVDNPLTYPLQNSRGEACVYSGRRGTGVAAARSPTCRWARWGRRAVELGV